jgi:ribonuclease E
MFPDVRHLIAAVVASVVALSCGFAMFATFRVNHEPLSRLAAGAAPLQLAAGNPTPGVAMPMPADSFGNRFPLNQADSAGASAEATPRQAGHDDDVEPPSAVAGITATAPVTDAAEPAPVAQAPEPDAKPDDVAAAPSEPPAITPSEAPPATTSTVAAEPPPEQPAEPAAPAPTQQANQEPNPESPDTAATAATEPSPPEAHPKAAHQHRLAAKAQRARQARAIVQAVSQPPGLGGPLVPVPNRLAARPQRARQARAIVQPVSQPSGVGGPFVPPPPTNR